MAIFFLYICIFSDAVFLIRATVTQEIGKPNENNIYIAFLLYFLRICNTCVLRLVYIWMVIKMGAIDK